MKIKTLIPAPAKPETVVEVFKTNVNDEQAAIEIISILKTSFPDLKINFDLEDCDKILRIKTHNGFSDIKKIIKLVEIAGFYIEPLQ